MALLEASGIGKNFGETHVLKDISLDLEQGEALAIIGSSGSGKTTLLRCLNFLERPDTGVIKVNGETMWDAADPATQKESEIRKKRLHFGLVFQNFNLFPQYTALQNVMLAGELLAKERPEYQANKKAIHAELEQQARELLAQMGLSERAGHYPHQLSGGMKQRLLLAQAILDEPDILILDEPTAGLDPRQRIAVRNLIAEIALQKIVIVSTHVVPDVEYVASELLLLSEGRLLRKASPAELTHELNGQVWEAELAESELPAAQAAGTVCGIARVDAGHIRVRLLAEKQPPFACRPLAPELEDVYLHYFGAEDGL